jgi:hypothetical protein
VYRSLVAMLLLPAVCLAAPVPKAKSEGKLLVVTQDGKATLMNPDGGEPQVVVEVGKGELVARARLSPDGTRVVYAVRPDAKKLDAVLYVRDLDGGKAKELFKVQHAAHLLWSPDGKAVYVSGLDVEKGNQPAVKRNESWLSWTVDAATGRPTPLDAKGEYRAWGFTPKGDELLCVRTFDLRPVGKGVQAPKVETVRTKLDAFDPKGVIPAEADLTPLAALPDGERWVVYTPKEKVGVYSAKGELTEWPDIPGDSVPHAAVAPDGKRLAFAVHHAAKPGVRRAVLVSDANGGDVKTVWEPKVNILDIDWR